ncbi:MAG: flagellar type III secretion system pore protein FliP [Thermoguttaceae bacterium]
MLRFAFTITLIIGAASHVFAQGDNAFAPAGSPNPPSIFVDSNDLGVNRDGIVRALANLPDEQEFLDKEPHQDGDLSMPFPSGILRGPDFWTSPDGLVPTLQIMILLTVLTLSPALLMMTTSFIRIMVVLSILRQAIGTNQLPPSQVITGIALFMTFLIMMPTWKEVYYESVKPYTERTISLEEAYNKAELPIRRFMAAQIDRTGNHEDVVLFLRYCRDVSPEMPQTYRQVPIRALVPAYMLSELKTAFMIGFQIFLPFLVLDMIVASVMVSMGMMMLPPVIISLPFKLMLFVLMDGWNLVVKMLLESFIINTT